MSSRPDGFVLGQDPAGTGSIDETLLHRPADGCARCRREWPSVTYRQLAKALGEGKTVDNICDRCWTNAGQEVASLVDEAMAVHPTAPGLHRYVEVDGIESKTNVVKFRYATHTDAEVMVVTDLYVWFKGKPSAEPAPPSCYVYRKVPVAVCEAWYAAPLAGQSFGGYFISFIKGAYDFERVTT